jgi:hypothetical protein
MHTVYTTDTATGVEKYGEHFKGFDWLGFWHLGSAQLNSKWHNSPTFFPAHAYGKLNTL